MTMETLLRYFQELNMGSTFLRLMLAALFGGVVGMERGRRKRAAGLRTHMLVCIGAALVMLTNQYITAGIPGADPTRLGAQVISGIGFLGVGTIIVDRQQQVRGLTTAAGLWTCACMGLALGSGFYSGALIAFFFILGTIVTLDRLERYVINKTKLLDVYAEFETHADINLVIDAITGRGIQVVQVEIVCPHEMEKKDDLRAAANLMLKLARGQYQDRILRELNRLDGVIYIKELH